MNIKTGDIVTVTGKVDKIYLDKEREPKSYWRHEIIIGENRAKKGHSWKSIYKALCCVQFDIPKRCIVLGKSTRVTGVSYPNTYDDLGGILPDTVFPVWMVMELSSNRYRKPFAALETMIIPVEDETTVL